MKNNLELTGYDDALINIIKKAETGVLNIAKSQKGKSLDELKPQWRHRRLSQSWVKYLANELEKYFRKDFHNNNIFAFPSNYDLKKALGIKRSEFLFDVSVGEYYSFKSSVKKKTIWFQSHPLWQIESEFSNDMREIAIDFSKLLAGKAPFQMMVGPAGDIDDDETPYLTDMAQLADHCDSELYFLFLNHPGEWYGDGKLTIMWKLYKWEWTRWYQIGPSK